MDKLSTIPYTILYKIAKDLEINDLISLSKTNRKINKLLSDPRFWIYKIGSSFVELKPNFISYIDWLNIHNMKENFIYNIQTLPTRSIIKKIKKYDKKHLLGLCILCDNLTICENEKFWCVAMGEDFIKTRPNNYKFIEWLEIVLENNLLNNPVDDILYGAENGLKELVEYSLYRNVDKDVINESIKIADDNGHYSLSEYLSIV